MRLEWDARKSRENLRKHGIRSRKRRVCSSILSRRPVVTRIIRSVNGVMSPLEFLRSGSFSWWRILREGMPSASSALAGQPAQKGSSMKKARKRTVDELRPEYKRSDFGELVRGKYAARLREKSNVVVLDPRVAKFFPNATSVNSALLSLAEVAKRSARLPQSRTRKPA